MDDIVTRLRRIAAKPLGMVIDPPPHPLCQDAADEIERLRSAGDSLASAIYALCTLSDDWESLDLDEVQRKWDIARHNYE